MKAILLAAGAGTRLRPLTDNMPKCLVPLAGTALLELWLNKLSHTSVSEVLINGHTFAAQVAKHIDSVRSRYAFEIHFVLENPLLGTGGTLIHNRDFADTTEELLVCHADNYTDIDLNRFANFHRNRKLPLSLALFRTECPQSCGIVEELDERATIQRFVEKPTHSKSNLASAAIFLMRPTVLDQLVPASNVDFSKEVLPRMQGHMAGFEWEGFNIDVGTPDNYARACKMALARMQRGTAEFRHAREVEPSAAADMPNSCAGLDANLTEPLPKAALPSTASRLTSKH